MNYRGDLLKLIIKDTASADLSFAVGDNDEKRPALLSLGEPLATQFVYLGNHICWMVPNKTVVYIFNPANKGAKKLDLSSYAN